MKDQAVPSGHEIPMRDMPNGPTREYSPLVRVIGEVWAPWRVHGGPFIVRVRRCPPFLACDRKDK